MVRGRLLARSAAAADVDRGTAGRLPGAAAAEPRVAGLGRPRAGPPAAGVAAADPSAAGAGPLGAVNAASAFRACCSASRPAGVASWWGAVPDFCCTTWVSSCARSRRDRSVVRGAVPGRWTTPSVAYESAAMRAAVRLISGPRRTVTSAGRWPVTAATASCTSRGTRTDCSVTSGGGVGDAARGDSPEGRGDSPDGRGDSPDGAVLLVARVVGRRAFASSVGASALAVEARRWTAGADVELADVKSVADVEVDAADVVTPGAAPVGACGVLFEGVVAGRRRSLGVKGGDGARSGVCGRDDGFTDSATG